jgi:ferrous-iron efflux pump FieF
LPQSALGGHREGQEIARVSALILVIVGIMEIGVGTITNSMSLTADGIDSFSDAAISLIVWFGLRLSLKAPSRYFHYGYYKVESLAAFGTSVGMIGIASIIVYRAYMSLLRPHRIFFPAYAIVALIIAGSVSLYYAIRMRRVAKKHGLVSLQISAANSIKDASASFVVLASVALAAFGIIWMDSIGAIIISVFIYSIAYVALRESSLVLLDSFNSPEVVEGISSIVRSIRGVKDVTEIKLRHSGPFLSGRVKIAVDSNLSVGEASKISAEVETTLSKEIGSLKEFVILLTPYEMRK